MLSRVKPGLDSDWRQSQSWKRPVLVKVAEAGQEVTTLRLSDQNLREILDLGASIEARWTGLRPASMGDHGTLGPECDCIIQCLQKVEFTPDH